MHDLFRQMNATMLVRWTFVMLVGGLLVTGQAWGQPAEAPTQRLRLEPGAFWHSYALRDQADFGETVALHGPYLAVSASGADVGDSYAGVNVGAVVMYRRAADGTWRRDALLQAPDPEQGDRFGELVALHGQRVFATACDVDAEMRCLTSIHVFERTDAGTWTHVDRIGANETLHGFGDALDVDGDRLLVGAPTAGFLYRRTSQGTWTLGARLDIPDDHPSHSQALRLPGSIDLDGSTVALGFHRSSQRSVHVFRKEQGAWAHQTRIEAPASADRRSFGAAVRVSGGRLFVGAPGRFGGAVHVYTETNPGTWTPTDVLDTPRRTVSHSEDFGRHLAVQGDTLYVTEYAENAVFAFSHRAGSWRPMAVLIPGEYDDHELGESVSASRSYVAASSRSPAGAGPERRPSVYVYRLNAAGEDASSAAGDSPASDSACPSDLAYEDQGGNAPERDGRRLHVEALPTGMGDYWVSFNPKFHLLYFKSPDNHRRNHGTYDVANACWRFRPDRLDVSTIDWGFLFR
jgi:hypothetical protein